VEFTIIPFPVLTAPIWMNLIIFYYNSVKPAAFPAVVSTDKPLHIQHL
jgi:hypothetical protein